MPFDPDQYLKEKTSTQGSFDPDAYLAEKHGIKPAVISENGVEAALQGFGNAATFGYLPELQAAAEKITTPLFNLVTGNDVQNDPYEVSKANYADRANKLQEENPIAYGAGAVTGSIASSALPAGVVGKGAEALKIASPIARAAAAGALESGMYKPEEGQSRLSNAVSGGLTGGAFQAGTKALGAGYKAIKSIPGKLEDAAVSRAVGAVGAQKKHITSLLKQGGGDTKQIKEVGKFIIDNDLAPVGAAIEDIAENASKLKEKTGKAIGVIYNSSGATFNPRKLAIGAFRELKDDLVGTPGGDKALNSVKGVLTDLARNKQNMPVEELLSFRSKIDDLIPYGKDAMSKPEKDALYKVRDFLQKQMDESIDASGKLVGKDELSRLKELNNRYKNLSRVDQFAKDRIASEQGNNMMSLTDKIAGIGIAGNMLANDSDRTPEDFLKAAAIGGGAALGSKAMRTYGRPLMMKGMLGASRALDAGSQAVQGMVEGSIGRLPKPNISPERLGAGAVAMDKSTGKQPVPVISEALMDSIRKNPQSINQIQNKQLRDKLKVQLEMYGDHGGSDQSRIQSDQEARQKFIQEH